MPRETAESRAASFYRAGSKHREAPAHLTKAAQKLWDDIVQARPTDYFAPGSFELLEQYCELTCVQRKTMKLIAAGKQRDSMGASYINRARELAQTLSTLATKLRLSIQSAERKSRAKDAEKGAGDVAGDRLLGGTAVWGEKSERAN